MYLFALLGGTGAAPCSKSNVTYRALWSFLRNMLESTSRPKGLLATASISNKAWHSPMLGKPSSCRSISCDPDPRSTPTLSSLDRYTRTAKFLRLPDVAGPPAVQADPHRQMLRIRCRVALRQGPANAQHQKAKCCDAGCERSPTACTHRLVR